MKVSVQPSKEFCEMKRDLNDEDIQAKVVTTKDKQCQTARELFLEYSADTSLHGIKHGFVAEYSCVTSLHPHRAND